MVSLTVTDDGVCDGVCDCTREGVCVCYYVCVREWKTGSNLDNGSQ